MTEEWNHLGVEQRRICGLEVQNNVMDGTVLPSHDRLVVEPLWNSGVKERTNWYRRRRQRSRIIRQAWPRSSNSYTDPGQGPSSRILCRDRMRNIKFTEEENDVLVTKVLENYPKLYGDDATRTSSSEKKRIWRGILESINCLGVSVRNMDTCKKRFTDCKRFVRAKMSKHWQHTTTGPALNVYYTDWEEKIKAIICPLGEGIPGLIDSADPYTYDCPGQWSPHGNASPEAQLSPEESATPEAQFYPDTQESEDHGLQTEDAELDSFKEHTVVSVKEEAGDSEVEIPQLGDFHPNPDSLTPEEHLAEPPSEGEDLPEMDQLLYQSQVAFRQTLRQQLHAVRQELREFRRDHVERMDLLLTLHREHIAVEEQRNQILSQLVSTVNRLATKLSTEDTGEDGQYLQPPLTSTSPCMGENTSNRTNTPDLQIPQNASSQENEDLRLNRRSKRTIHHGPVTTKRRK
ncbi:myb-related transcription factor, partner of profilin-like [Pseudophryne corroboree]|uniref:myb-related transcription factor, partner of profilin-like n=1 Tax=Pseudophryne corroboree TaxID=495146 RepID=UPI00308139BA